MAMPPRIHIVGRKNSGKTTLIVDLVTHFTRQGFAVGTIKHTHHQHELDTPGKDSHCHREAGAAVVGILARQMNAVFWSAEEREEKAVRYSKMLGMFANCRLVLVEGDSQTSAPKVEVWRAATNTEPLAATDGGILAVISDDLLDLGVPRLARSDVPALAEWLLRTAS